MVFTSRTAAQSDFICPCNYDSDAQLIIDQLRADGFVQIPIKVLPPSAARPAASVSECLFDTSEPDLIKIGSNQFSLSGTLSSACQQTQGTVFLLTDNTLFDNNEYINTLNQFSISPSAVWYHVVELSCDDLGAQDFLFIKVQDSVIPGSCQSNTILVNGWDYIFPDVGTDEFTYVFMQKTFGPWTDFRHLSIPFVPVPFATNSFDGDNRTFSLDYTRPFDGDVTNASDVSVYDCNITGNVTSRTHQAVQFTLGQSDIDCESRYSSGTRGTGEFVGDPRIDCDRLCYLEANINGYAEFSSSNLYALAEGSDPCISISTDISTRSYLSFTTTTIDGKRYLRVRGILATKGFPTHEYVLEDRSGQRIMLKTFSPTSEEDLVEELLGNAYDVFFAIDYSIEIDPISGFFKTEIITSELSGNTTFRQNGIGIVNSFPSPIFGANICHLELDALGDEPTFTYTTSTIASWNSLQLGSDPAGDCPSIPCTGILGECE